LHLYDKPVFVATDVEHHAIIAANTGTGVEQLDLTRAKPNRFTRFFIPTVKRPSSIGTPGFSQNFLRLFLAITLTPAKDLPIREKWQYWSYAS